MAINQNDIVFLESKGMTDTPDAGGEMTARTIANGETGNLWPDISRLDRTLGGVELRKIFLAVQSATAETYSGAHVIINQPANDPRVNMLLMSLGDHYDKRQDATDQIESFIIKAGRAEMDLNGKQLEGQTELKLWAPIGSSIPRLGETLVLIEDGDVNTEQYIKITGISSETKNFTYYHSNTFQTFAALSIVMKISEPLKRDYLASGASPLVNNDTVVLKTQPANGGEYFSCRPLVSAAEADALSIKVDAIEQSLFPVATIEKPLIDLPLASGQTTRKISDATITINATGETAAGSIWYLPRPPVPGTLTVIISGATYKEVGGELVKFSGSEQFNATPTIDLKKGTITYSAKTANASAAITYSPALASDTPLFTEATEVSELTRGLNWTFNLNPLPAPGTVAAYYLNGDDWIKLTDNGAGELVGTGSGSVNYETGSAVLTCAALPELGSGILISWMGENLSPAAIPATVDAQISLAINATINDAPIAITWLAGGQAKTLNSTGIAAPFTGDGSGTTGQEKGKTVFYITPDSLPDDGQFSIDYQYYTPAPAAESITVGAVQYNDSATILDIQLGGPQEGGSLSFTLNLVQANRREYRGFFGGVTVGQQYCYHDVDFISLGQSIYIKGSKIGSVGSVNGAGLISIDLTKLAYKCTDKVLNDRGPGFRGGHKWDILSTTKTTRRAGIAGGAVSFTYMETGAATATATVDASATLTATIAEELIFPGATVLEIDGALYFDDEKGRLLTGFSPVTGAANVVGSIDYSLNAAIITLDTPPSAAPAIVPLLSVARTGDEIEPMLSAFFYIPDTPIRPGTLQIMFNNFEGDRIILKADPQGLLYEHDRDSSGRVMGESMPASPSLSIGGLGYSRSGLSLGIAADWGQIDYSNGQILVNFKDAIPPQNVTINAVQAATIPLDSDIIGLDGVRMPSTGKVPVFKPGNVLVIHDTQETDAATPTAGQVFNLGRLDLSGVNILDATGAELDPAQYTPDLAAGLVTMADPLVLQTAGAQALTPPLTIENKIDTMVLCSDVALDGTLNLATPLPRAMPETSLVSSAAVAGDIAPLLLNLFSQSSDVSGVYMESPTATATNARLNDLDHPIEMSPRGAVFDKWKIKFKTITAFDLFSERRGEIMSGSTESDLAPINPTTGEPYFIIRADAWGGGWLSGNIVRFNTTPAAMPLWCIRSIQPGPASFETDSFSLQARGDTDQ